MKTVVVIIDALGADLAERYRFDVPGLSPGRRLGSVFGFSQAALTTILTGSPPDRHGLWMMYAFSNRSPFAFLRMLPGCLDTDRRIVRRFIRWKIHRLNGVGAYYSLYDIPKDVLSRLDIPARRPLFEEGGGQGVPTLLDRALERGERCFVRDYRYAEPAAFDELDQALESGGFDFHLLYTAGLDATLHRVGTGHEETEARLRWYEQRLASIVEAADRLFVLGDHGMCDVEQTVDLQRSMQRLDPGAAARYLPFYDSTMARFRVTDPETRRLLESFLSGLGCGRLIDEEEQRRLGVFFDDGRFGDVIFAVEPGTVIAPSFMGRQAPAGMHGYHPDASCMDSLLLSSEPADGCNHILDVASLVEGGRV